MRIRDLHELPKLRDGLSYLYLEHCMIEQKYKAVEAIDKEHGRTLLPAAALAVLMLGPGTSISHEAVKTLCDNGCSVLWCGEEGVRLYAHGIGETRKGYRLIRQAELVSDPIKRMEVIARMYRYRFDEELESDLSLEQVRGYEGVRVRKAYAQASEKFAVPWSGRRYDREDWAKADPINRALSTANACLNGLCHAAIVSVGYSPGLGFIHTGKQLSFVYDIADLYKTEITVPLAFRLTAESSLNLETRIRHACRDLFRETQLLARILPDIDKMLAVLPTGDDLDEIAESDPAWPAKLWSHSTLTMEETSQWSS
ncbi:MAG: type I-E CRISPR-associated endonuclease Cas1e [Anaerolineae bacterium]